MDIPVDDVAMLLLLVCGNQRVGSEPLLSPQPLSKAQSGMFDVFDAESAV